MERLMMVILAALLAVSAVSPAIARTATGTTNLLSTPSSGGSVDVDVSVISETPVVAYEYSIQNECTFGAKSSGRSDSIQSDPIVNWLYSDASGSVPHAIMTIDFTSIPTGSNCRLFLLGHNQVVKGSTTTYDVH